MTEPSAPLKPAWFHILLALAEEAQHGFAIRERVETLTRGQVHLWPATLYGSIRDLVALEAIEALEGDDDPDGDQRRRYYRITAAGRQMLKAEADRLQGLVDAARSAATLRGA